MHLPTALASLRRSSALRLMLLVLCLLISTHATAQVRRNLGERGGGGLNTGGFTPVSNTSSNRSGSNNPNATNDSTFGSTDSSAIIGLQYHTETPDSILRSRVFLFFYRPSEVKLYEVWNPTLDPTGVQFNDPLDALNGDYYLGKGMLGHPHTSLFPTPTDGIGLRLQTDPNIGYTKRPSNIRFYQTMTPYTVLSYNSSLNKDYLVRVAHTQNILPGWNVSFDYRLIHPEGIYTSSSAKNHYLDATTNYFSRDARLQALAGIIWQSFNIDENGGISDDTYFTERRQSNRNGVPVNLYNMGSVHRELAAFGHATYNFVRQFEATRTRDSLVARQIDDSTTVLDTIELVDTIPLRQPSMLNLGIIGVELNYDRRKRVFTDSTWWQERSATLFWTNDAYLDHRWRNPFKLTLGVTPRLVTAVVDADTLRLRSSLDPFGRAVFDLGHAELRAEAEMNGSFDIGGKPDSRMAATLLFHFDSARRTVASLAAVSQRHMPDVRLVHDAIVGQNTYLNPIATEAYSLTFRHDEAIDLDIRASHMSHNTWYDSTRYVHQGNSPLWLYQARLTTRLAIGWFHLDMQHMLQHSTDTIQLPVPLWASKSSVYADIKPFGGVLHAQIGVDLRYHTSYFAPGYDPYTGLFYHQDEVRIGNYIWADVFINVNVKRASFYAKAGHVNALWDSAPNYFILPHYPGQNFGFYWGITWHFFD